MEAMGAANRDHAIAYGDDDWTREACRRLQAVFGEDVEPYFVLNGTGANMVALQALVRPFHSIIAASSGHICVDECGAPARFMSCSVKEVATGDGKLDADSIRPLLHGFGDAHHSQPGAIYLSQATELGTVYRPAELRAIADLAHTYNMYVHMDGSRLANACAFLGVGMAELTRDCGIDILSLGGTKNGMMLGEAVLAFRPELQAHLKYYRKQSAQLYSKMRYLGAQFMAYLEDDLWLHNARKANAMTQLLAEAIRETGVATITQAVESNAIFLTMDRATIEAMREKYFFYTWNEEKNEIRLICSWDTTEADVSGFVERLRACV
jgi:threonine aldolase